MSVLPILPDPRWPVILEMLGVRVFLPYLIKVGELYYVFYVLYHISSYYIAFIIGSLIHTIISSLLISVAISIVCRPKLVVALLALNRPRNTK